jgi:hypothetical protein
MSPTAGASDGRRSEEKKHTEANQTVSSLKARLHRQQNLVAPCRAQGDQIGRIIAYWAITFFGQSIENYISSANSRDSFIHSTSYVLIWTKICLGYTLGDFFTNSSGHPG